MDVKELHEALGKMVAAGHGEATVSHVNGTGKATPLCGWELVTSSSYEPARGANQQVSEMQLKLHTTSRF